MKGILDIESWYQSVAISVQEAGVAFSAFLPKVLLALLVAAVGWLVARAIQAVAGRVLRKAGADRLGRSSRIADSLRNAGVASPISVVVARVLFWAVLLTFGLFALQALGIAAVARTLERVIGLLPHLFAAAVIIIVGVPLSRLVKNLTTSGAAAARVAQAQRLGVAAQAIVAMVVGVLALSQVGIDTGLLITVITTLVATVGLSMGLAFALGAKPIVTHILAGHFLRQNLSTGTSVEVLGRSGQIRTVGAVATVIASDDREWLVPNDKVLNEVLGR